MSHDPDDVATLKARLLHADLLLNLVRDLMPRLCIKWEADAQTERDLKRVKQELREWHGA